MAAGFFGIGGKLLMVPGADLSTGMPMIIAVGSSLLAVGTFGLTTALNYARGGMVDWHLAAEFIAGGLVGGIAGMLLATRLSSGERPRSIGFLLRSCCRSEPTSSQRTGRVRPPDRVAAINYS